MEKEKTIIKDEYEKRKENRQDTILSIFEIISCTLLNLLYAFTVRDVIVDCIYGSRSVTWTIVICFCIFVVMGLILKYIGDTYLYKKWIVNEPTTLPPIG